MELLDLNDDCLHKLCEYLDAECIVAFANTSKNLSGIAENYFKYKKTFQCLIESVQSEVLAANAIKKVGKFFTKIHLMIERECHSLNVGALFELLSRSIGPNLTELKILGEMCHLPLESLMPIMSQLEILSIQNVCTKEHCVLKINVSQICPNLQQLTVSGQLLFMPWDAQELLRLEHLDVAFDVRQSTEVVFLNSSRLKTLHLRRTTKNWSLNRMRTWLPALEELQLDVEKIKNSVRDLTPLSQFPNLQSLELYRIPSECFDNVLKTLVTVAQLKKVKIHSEVTRLNEQYSMIQQSLVDIADSLHELKSFVTVDIDWMPESVLEFVGKASSLIYFEFWSGVSNIEIRPTFIRKLAKIRRSVNIAKMQPLELKMFAMNDSLREVFAEPAIKKYLLWK